MCYVPGHRGMTACPEAMAAMVAMAAPHAGITPRVLSSSRRLSVPTTPRVLAHRLTAEGLDKCWLAPARALQERTDQPLPHDLTVDDFRAVGRQTEAAWASRTLSAFEPIPSAGEPSGWQSRDPATAPVYDPFQPLLYGIAGGAGLSMLRTNTTRRHRQILQLHSPHELALAAVGLSLRLGVKPLRREHLVHSTQRKSVQADAHPWIPSEVTMVACLQDCASGRDGANTAMPEPDINHCLVGAYNVWAAKAADLLEHVRHQMGPQVAQLLLEPHYEYTGAALQQVGPAETGAVTSVFQLTEHRAASRLRTIDPGFGANWVDLDGVANPALTRTRILMNPAHVQVAPSGTQAHADALESLQSAAMGSHEAQQLRWDRLQLLAGDVLVADNTVLLTPTEPTSHGSDTRLHAQAEPHRERQRETQRQTQTGSQDVVASFYEEVAVLRSCAKSKHAAKRRAVASSGSSDDNDEAVASATSHALWVGHTIQHSPALKWWWW